MSHEDNREVERGNPPVSGLVPLLPVLDVERSAAFYRLLGFAVGNRVPEDGPMEWAWLYAPAAPDWRRGPNPMLARSSCVPDPAAQEIQFYLYAADLVGLREQLVGAGQSPGPIRYPAYLPKGEMELRDPDGYCLMLAQSDANTP